MLGWNEVSSHRIGERYLRQCGWRSDERMGCVDALEGAWEDSWMK